MGENWAVAVESFHLLVIIFMVTSLGWAMKPLEYPRLSKLAVVVWVVVPLSQAACGGRCPLTVLAHFLAHKNTEYPSFTRELLGMDIPWWASLAFGVAVATISSVFMIRHRRKWQRYARSLEIYDAVAREAAASNKPPKHGGKRRRKKAKK